MQHYSDPRASQSYLIRREQQERTIAAQSADAMVRRIHLELADRYAAMANAPLTIAA